jgi:outer membrane protein assembly factor BamB
MRPPCLEGVIVAHGMLYWGPWMCGCPLAFYGHVGLTGAGGFNYQPGLDASRLEPGEGDPAKVQELAVAEGDSMAWSADPRQSSAKIAPPKQVAQAWELKLSASCRPAGAAAAGGLVFTADRSGAIRALDAVTAAPKWKAYADGAIFYPPSVWNSRLYVGAADGRVYAFEAATGRRLWAFRLAPAERWIPVFGHLASTWPVAGGVVVRDGVVYAAAGMADYDGTHVTALDAVTGKPLWYNDTAGRMSDTVRSGISLQGELMLRDGKLCFAGGGVYGIAMFDAKTGKCLNDPVHALGSRNPTAFYAHYPEYGQYVALDYTLPDGRTLSYEPLYDGSRHAPLALLRPVPAGQQPPPPGWRLAWRRPNDPPKPAREAVWTDPSLRQFNAFVVTPSVLLAAGQGAPGSGVKPFVVALAIEDGAEVWRHDLPVPPVKGGLAVDHTGRVFVSLADGRLLCLAPAAAK